ncbi:MAG: HD domain-containing protein [Cyanobacteria bacterium RI_101]|nr:HD domain-containing protein [Cyanobacteria bacterium RI_101]
MELDRERVIAWLKEEVSAERLAHIFGVEAMSRELALVHGADPELAAQAGLLHDLAKFFPKERLLKLARQAGLTLDPILEATPHLIHADVSALVAQQEFGVKNPKILGAIRHHTLGEPGMGKLSRVVFVADALEPNRGDSPDLTALRQTARVNLDRAVRQTCDRTLSYLLKHQKTIHPRLVETRNWALQRERKETDTL